MKKIMIAAAAAALAGVTFAAGNTFEYKASVKYVDMNKKSVTVDHNRFNAYIKVVKTASLTGYLVVDPTCPCTTPGAAPKLGFLVVENKAKKTGPKLFPANLYAKWWRNKVNAKTLQAEGYLFAGIGKIEAVGTTEVAQSFGDNTAETSKLFGAYNMAYTDPATQQKTFFESWLDAAGFGTASFAEGEEEGCDIGEDGICLKNLAGSVIGGLFLCRENTLGEDFLCMNWNGTTDVISGTWSIKQTDKLTKHENFLTAELEAKGPDGQAAQPATNQNASKDTLLWVSAAGGKMKSGWTLADVDPAFRAKWF